ncbi:MAG: SsrA-binding protein SmpB [Myxococcota bacterium]
MAGEKQTGDKTVATNRKAHHEYTVEETWEAGIVLLGSEVKSLRDGAVTIGDGYVLDHDDELYLYNVHIQEYAQANRMNHEPLRRRKLLLKRGEIDEIKKLLREKGRSCVPLRFYFKNGRCKVEIAAASGKKLHDKREDMKSKDAQREMDRAKKSRGRDDG